MAATTKLIIYNEVLREIGSHKLADLTAVNTRLTTLNDAFSQAVEYLLSKKDWSFARRRQTLAGVADTSFPPYAFRYSKPSDYLRKTWVKAVAVDAQQADHAESGAVFYGFLSAPILEYVSDHADNYDPVNWPPHFTRCAVLYLAELVAPKLARAGSGEVGSFEAKFQQALVAADDFEAVFLTNESIPQNRLPVFRRAMEFLGQQLAGSVAVHSHADFLRWHMNQAFDHALKYVLEQGAWNYATRRATLTGGSEVVPGDVIEDYIEGYSLPPAVEPSTADLPDMAGFEYGYLLPEGFLHKIWIKADANRDFECHHQFMRNAVYTNVQPVVMEYIAWDEDSINPDNWTANFLEAVAAYLALLVAPELVLEAGNKGSARVSAPNLREKLEGLYFRKLSDAKLRDAIQQEPYTLRPGRFVQARRGGTATMGRYR
jgi:hypothetical protein